MICFSKCKERVFLKIRSTQQMLISPFSQAMIMVEPEQEGLTLATPKMLIGKLLRCSTALVDQNIKCNIPTKIILTSFTGLKNSSKSPSCRKGRETNKAHAGHGTNNRRNVESYGNP